jgi:hypothetical protein
LELQVGGKGTQPHELRCAKCFRLAIEVSGAANNAAGSRETGIYSIDIDFMGFSGNTGYRDKNLWGQSDEMTALVLNLLSNQIGENVR